MNDQPDGGSLRAANGSNIQTYGEKLLTLNIGLRRDFTFVFIVADVQYPIIGADFLSKFKINVDIHNRTLTDAETSVSVQIDTLISDQPNIYVTENGPHLEILNKFPSLTSNDDSIPVIKHQFQHRIITNGKPPCVRPRKLNPKMLKVVKETITKMLDEKIIRPSSSPYASPVHLVPKNQGFRLVGDYRALNKISQKDSYPLPFLQDFSLQLHNKKVFSKIDLKNAFYQLPIAEEDIPKTNITTPIGSFEYTRLNFGLCGAAQSFQRFIDCVLRNLKSKNSEKEVTHFAYIDDIIIASENEESHKKDLEALFERLSEYNIKINLIKCQFGKNSIDFLGHRVTEEGITPLPEKVSAVADFPLPQTYRQLRKFIGMVNFYHRFLKNAAGILAPLNSLLVGYKKSHRNRIISWTDHSTKAFENAKMALANATRLSYPMPEGQLALFCDASSIAVGSVLQQNVNGIWHPLGFFSRKLNKSQQLSSTFARELLAIYLSFKHFNHWIEGNKITVYTDHKPLLGAFNKPLDRPNLQEARQLSFITQYCPQIEHISGTNNIVADALSRPQIDSISISALSVLTHSLRERLIEAQKRDPTLKKILENKETSLNIQLVDEVYCDVQQDIIRPFIPDELRKEIFDQIHNLSHPGVKQSIELISKRFVWYNMKKDIQSFVNSCNHCQTAKVVRYNKTIIKSIPNDVPKFSTVHIDVVGPLPPNQGFSYLLTLIDRFTRWGEVVPLKDTKAETIANAFIFNWVSRFGVPDVIVSDRGTNFESNLFNDMLKQIGCQHKRTTAYNPKANGLIERWHKTLKSALRNGDSHTWLNRLPLVLLGMRVTFKAEIQCSPSEIMYGYPIKLPIDLIIDTGKSDVPTDTYVDTLKTAMRTLRPPVTRKPPQQKGYIDPKMEFTSHVFVKINNRQGLQPNFRGPYKVVERHDKYFVININGKDDKVSIDRLKPAVLTAELDDSGKNDNDSSNLEFSDHPVQFRPPENVQPKPPENVQPKPPENIQHEDNVSVGETSDNDLPKKSVTFNVPVHTRYGRKVTPTRRYEAK